MVVRYWCAEHAPKGAEFYKAKPNKSNVYDMGIVNGQILTYVNGALFATPYKKGKK
jgi:hypothetical protein